MNKVTALLSLACFGAFAVAVASGSSGKIPDYISADYTRDLGQGRLVTAAPYPSNRPDDPRRIQNGRLWIPRSPVGTRTPIRESVYGLPGPASYGAPAGAIDDVIYVQTREPLPVVVVSPWVNLDQQNIKHMRRDRPWIRRADSVLEDLRRAQVQHLTEQGYIQKVRTHVNPATLARMMNEGKPVADANAVPRPAAADDIKPRAVIRVKQRHSKPPEVEAAAPQAAPATESAKPEAVVLRVSVPQHVVAASEPVRVVKADGSSL